ncbi:DEAD/DEAH box helicase [Desulfomicrobium baculatum]|uniref:DEAD/DEAH box helicase domain protein n=1 Tax=Desulfomicrobium baculatum (strain DSM 4028 / VKM B-1378 / X) TaxID=525897 RepID=C7LPU2_DESBD|nr:DEAD/DEAH box helicase [Desulfomicrobium baculatum]ACU91424.1 DEAD/DEAH box helicase domain protein [Desulfomicrobium baculatum DSM 4028]
MTDTTDFGDAPREGSQTENFEGKAFSMADLPQTLQAAATRLNWAELMPVQVQTIPYMLGGQDVMVQSQTGSGKTGAFLLPILDRIETGLGAPQALVLVPTRELAVQVTRDAEELGREAGIKPLSIYGGVGYKGQIQGLEDGAQLIIGTPGRILDHLLKGNLNLDRLKILVFDEADRMLSMGFYPDMKQLQRYLPRGLQSAMFSATYPGHVKRLAQQFLKDPVFVSLSQSQVHVSDVLHVVYKVPAMQKSRILVKIIEQENPASAIIFCNTKADVHFVSTVLRRFGYDVGEISADLTQAAREEVLEKLRLNKLKFLVATDVAARGIDIHELSHVFQYQPPQDHEAYVHRTGRTGRAGAAGVAISFVSGMEEIELEQIAKKFSIPMVEQPLPADEELETLISQRAVFLLEARLRKADNIQKERMQRFMRTVGELAANDESRALLAMLVDEFYQGTFHAPLEQPSEKLVDMVRPVRPQSAPAQPAAPRAPRMPAPRPVPQTENIQTEQPADAAAVPAENGRPEGEKRRRKRSRKKPAAGADAALREQARPEISPEASDVQPAALEPAEVPAVAPEVVVEPQVSAPAVIPEKIQPPRSPRPPKPAPQAAPARAETKDEAVAAESVAPGTPEENVTEEGQPAAAPKKRRRRRPRKSGGAKPEGGNDVATEAAAPSGASAPAPSVAQAPAAPAPASRPPRGEPKAKSAEAPADDSASRTREAPRPSRKKPAEAKTEPPRPKKKIFLE